jgi:hypothetical protein
MLFRRALRIPLAFSLGSISLGATAYAAAMVDRAVRGYQDSPDSLYLSIAAVSFVVSVVTAALTALLIRSARKA